MPTSSCGGPSAMRRPRKELSVPVLILYIFVQRYIIEGVASSGIKG